MAISPDYVSDGTAVKAQNPELIAYNPPGLCCSNREYTPLVNARQHQPGYY
jgi:hypothetical protein